MSKVLWVDFETTGLSYKDNRITEVAFIYQDLTDPSKDDELSFYIKYDKYPSDYDSVVKITGLTIDFLNKNGIYEQEAFKRIINFLDSKVNKYYKSDKLIFAGYNTSFDNNFLRALFERANEKYFGSYFFSVCHDVMSNVAEALRLNKIPKLQNYKLSTVIDYFGIDLEAHKAIEDIKATIKLYNKLQEL